MQITTLDIEPKLPDPKLFVRPYPFRSPLVVAEVLGRIAQGKTFCDVGCGEGDILANVSPYAKEAVGFERDPDRYKVGINLGRNIMAGDWFKVPLPDAQIYYSWGPSPQSNITMTELALERPSCEKVIIGGRKGGKGHIHWAHEKWPQLYVWEFPYHEESNVEGWESHGIWWLGIIEK